MATVSDEIRRAIKQSGLTSYRIAKESGVDKATLSRFLRGERGLSMEGIDLLADYLGFKLVKAKGK